MEKIKGRLKLFIKENGGNTAEFARQLGIEPSHLASVISDKKRGLPASVIIAFAETGYDVQWLLTGKSNLNRITELEEELGDANRLIDSLERILKGGR